MLQVIIWGFDEKIKAYLDKFADVSEDFADKYKNSGKTIKGCCKYITDKMKELVKASGASGGSGCCQIEDDVVYQMAVGYFMEDEIKESKPTPTKPTSTKADSETKKSKPTKDKENKIKALKLPKNDAETETAKAQGKLIQLDLFA